MTGRWRFASVLGAAFMAGGLAVSAVADEPYLVRALSALQDANTSLNETHNNKGGHAQTAMALIARAETELRAVGP